MSASPQTFHVLLPSTPAPGPGGVLADAESLESGPELLGGKGAALAWLTRAGLPVPAWGCVTTAACAPVLASVAPEAEALLRRVDVQDAAALREASQQLMGRVREAGLARLDRSALEALGERLVPPGGRLAVRSSAVGEDSGRDSFAGQFDSFLHVPREELVERVLDCIASLYSERALLYRHLRGLASRPLSTAVLLQRMVDSRVAGVLFTANPTTGDRQEAVLSAGLGLGEGVVASRVECDTWFVALASGEVRERRLVPKRTRVAFDTERGTGTRLEEVPEPEACAPALTEAQVGELVALGRHVATLKEAPQDLEWALDAEGSLQLLQTRPITTLAEGRESIFDNANIVESYPGVSSPLTFSFVRPAYERTFRAAARAFGIPRAVIEENHALFENLVARVEGRIYYNILQWYRLYQLIPGFESALPAWEKALGLQHRAVRRAAGPTLAGRLRLLPVKLGMVARMGWQLLRLPGEVRRFLEGLERLQGDFRARDVRSLEAHALVELFERLGRALYVPFGVALVNDFFAQQLYEAVGRLAERWKLGDAPALRNGLLCGERGMDSVAPVHSALGLAGLIREGAGLRALFEGPLPAREVWEQLQRAPEHGAFRAALAAHLEAYGDRTLHELKLETPSLQEEPAFVISTLRNLLRGGQEVARMEAREQETRARTEASVAAALRGHPLRRGLFSLVLAGARRSVRYRENLRLGRTRAYGMVKRIFRALGERFAERGLLAGPGDIFFLTVEEVVGAVRGTGVTANLRALVALRREEHARFEAASPAPRVSTWGLVAAHPVAQASAPAAPEAGEVLRGTGCSQGRVTGTAKVILDPRQAEDIHGEVLVAPMTDPGWVFLMVASAGIVSERGSLLSHTAIIGRELGIPTVVGVPDVTRIIASGERVELDGGAGTVRRLPALEEKAS